ncbi:MAG: zinc finger MYND domain-containing protein [Bacteroidetes bacterium]|nr:zinc finger MYND domain-containing protein [Bacteroidota bacterium]
MRIKKAILCANLLNILCLLLYISCTSNNNKGVTGRKLVNDLNPNFNKIPNFNKKTIENALNLKDFNLDTDLTDEDLDNIAEWLNKNKQSFKEKDLKVLIDGIKRYQNNKNDKLFEDETKKTDDSEWGEVLPRNDIVSNFSQLSNNIDKIFKKKGLGIELLKYFTEHQFDEWKDIVEDINNGYDDCCVKQILFEILNPSNIKQQHNIYNLLTYSVKLDQKSYNGDADIEIIKDQSKESSSNNKYKCNYCNKYSNKSLKCSRCFKVNYCDTNCQRNDWKRHKKECKRSNKSVIKTAARKNNIDEKSKDYIIVGEINNLLCSVDLLYDLLKEIPNSSKKYVEDIFYILELIKSIFSPEEIEKMEEDKLYDYLEKSYYSCVQAVLSLEIKRNMEKIFRIIELNETKLKCDCDKDKKYSEECFSNFNHGQSDRVINFPIYRDLYYLVIKQLLRGLWKISPTKYNHIENCLKGGNYTENEKISYKLNGKEELKEFKDCFRLYTNKFEENKNNEIVEVYDFKDEEDGLFYKYFSEIYDWDENTIINAPESLYRDFKKFNREFQGFNYSSKFEIQEIWEVFSSSLFNIFTKSCELNFHHRKKGIGEGPSLGDKYCFLPGGIAEENLLIRINSILTFKNKKYNKRYNKKYNKRYNKKYNKRYKFKKGKNNNLKVRDENEKYKILAQIIERAAINIMNRYILINFFLCPELAMQIINNYESEQEKSLNKSTARKKFLFGHLYKSIYIYLKNSKNIFEKLKLKNPRIAEDGNMDLKKKTLSTKQLVALEFPELLYLKNPGLKNMVEISSKYAILNNVIPIFKATGFFNELLNDKVSFKYIIEKLKFNYLEKDVIEMVKKFIPLIEKCYPELLELRHKISSKIKSKLERWYYDKQREKTPGYCLNIVAVDSVKDYLEFLEYVLENDAILKISHKLVSEEEFEEEQQRRKQKKKDKKKIKKRYSTVKKKRKRRRSSNSNQVNDITAPQNNSEDKNNTFQRCIDFGPNKKISILDKINSIVPPENNSNHNKKKKKKIKIKNKNKNKKEVITNHNSRNWNLLETEKSIKKGVISLINNEMKISTYSMFIKQLSIFIKSEHAFKMDAARINSKRVIYSDNWFLSYEFLLNRLANVVYHDKGKHKSNKCTSFDKIKLERFIYPIIRKFGLWPPSQEK